MQRFGVLAGAWLRATGGVLSQAMAGGIAVVSGERIGRAHVTQTPPAHAVRGRLRSQVKPSAERPSPRWSAKVFTAWTVLMAGASVTDSGMHRATLLTGAVSGLAPALILTILSIALKREEWRETPDGRTGQYSLDAEALTQMVYGDEQPPDIPR